MHNSINAFDWLKYWLYGYFETALKIAWSKGMCYLKSLKSRDWHMRVSKYEDLYRSQRKLKLVKVEVAKWPNDLCWELLVFKLD